jgi:hypothetical protein
MESADRTCPVCGRGVLKDLSFDEPSGEPAAGQQPTSRQIVTYSCGHERVGPRLEESASGDSDLDVERGRQPTVPTPDP